MQSQGLRSSLRVLLCLATVAFVSVAAQSQQTSTSNDSSKRQALATFRSLNRPLSFEVNQGQADKSARFLSRGPGYQLLLTPNEAVVSVAKPRQSDPSHHQVEQFESPEILHVKLQGANPKDLIAGEDKLAAKSNYYLGNDSSKWQVGVPNYSRVRYSGIYPGIDLVYYGNEKALEHDFVVAPGADPNRIRLALSGTQSIHLDSNGDVVMDLSNGSLRLLKPVVYQEVAGKHQAIDARYELSANNTARFVLGHYDRRRQLIIDPVLSYSSYLGGTGQDSGYGVAVKGNTVYVTGNSGSTDFLGTSSSCCTFVTALNLTSGLVYSTYISAEVTGYYGNPIAIDGSGNAYITGTTFGGLPIVTSGLPSTYQGGWSDGFVAKVSPSGTLVASGYLGGSGKDYGQGIGFDLANSHVLITGGTQSGNFLQVNPALGAPASELFVNTNAAQQNNWTITSGSGVNGIHSDDIQAMLIVPGVAGPSTYYVGGSAGVYKSTDGANWALVPGITGRQPISFAYNATTGALFAGTDGGLYKYSGGVFSYVNGGPQNAVVAVAFNPSVPATVYASDSNQGFYVSTDSGNTWTLQNNGLPVDANGYVNSMSFAVSSSGTLYAAINNPSGSQFFSSVNGGATWNAPEDSFFPSNVTIYSNHNYLYVDDAGGRIFFLAPSGAYVSTDNGNDWSPLGPLPIATSFNVILPDPGDSGTLYLGTDNGLFRSSDSGNSWTEIDDFFASSVATLAIDTVASNSTEQTVLYAGSYDGQGFETSLDSGLTPVFSTLIGGDGPAPNLQNWTNGYATAADASGNVYVGGNTYSTGGTLPASSSGAQPNALGGEDGFLLKLSPTGSALWSTFVGGSSTDYVQAVAVASDGSAVVTGHTYSSDLPTTPGAYQPFCSANCPSGFFAKYASDGSNVFSTYFSPGQSGVTPSALALDSANNIYFAAGTAGYGSGSLTNPLDLPTSGLTNNTSGYVGEMNSAGSAMLFSTPIGGNTPGTYTTATGIAVDSNGAIYVAGVTTAPDFPIAGPAIQSTLNRGAANGNSDAFLVQITTTGKTNDIAVQVTPTNPVISVGGTQVYNVTVTNLTTTGTGASNVVLIGDITLTGLTSSTGTCTASPARCAIGTLAPGASVNITATATYTFAGSIPATFTVRTDDNDPNPANNTASVLVTVVGTTGSDIGVTLTGPATAAHGSQFNYTLTVTNYGPQSASYVQAGVTLDNNLIFDYADSGCYDDGGIYCTVVSLNPGDSQSFNITVQAPSNLGNVISTASVNYEGDPDNFNNTSSLVTSILPSADLYGYFSENNYATVGAPLNVTATLSNGGPDQATNVTLTLNLPQQLSLSSKPANCTGTAPVITCTIGFMDVDSNNQIQLPVVANYPGVYTILANLQDAGGSINPYPGDNQFSLAVHASTNGQYASESYVVSLIDSGQLLVNNTGDTGTQYATTFKATSAPAISALDVSGRYLYVSTSGFSGYTAVVDTTIQQEVARIHGIDGRPMVLTPDGAHLISRVASTTTDALAVVDTSTFQIVKTISLDGLFGDQTGVSDLNLFSGVVANNKLYLQLAYNPTGSSPLFTTAVIDLGTYTVRQVTGAGSNTTGVPNAQHSIAASADGTKVFALRVNPLEMLVIDTSSDTVVNTVSLPLNNVFSIVTTRDANDTNGQSAYISGKNSDSTSVILDYSITSAQLQQDQVSMSFSPTNMVLSADGYYLYAFQALAPPGNTNAALFYTHDLTYANDGDNEFSVPGVIGGVSIGFVSTNVSFGPSISSTQPASIDNSVANRISILGTNFAQNSRVRIGSLDAMPATFVSTGRLDVNLPALVPEQDAEIVVTVPNTQELPTGRNVSASSEFKVHIGNSTFNLPSPILLMEYGDSILNSIDTSKNGTNISTLPNPTSIALAPDNQTAYVSSGLYPLGVQAINMSTGQAITTIPLYNDFVGYQDALATGFDPVDGKAVLYFNHGDAAGINNQLSVVDADSTSATFNQVKRTISSNDGAYAGASGALAASPNGRYVYTFADAYDDSGAFLQTNLLAYDAQTGASSSIQNVKASFNGEEKRPNHMRVSPDGNWILVPGADGSIKALNISADPMLSNYTVTTIGDGNSYKTFQVVGSELFAFDANSNTVSAFNFVPASSNFSKLGSVTLSGSASYYEAPLFVDPTGAYVYVALKDQDALALLDAQKVANSDPTALLDAGGNSFGIEAILIPGTVTPQVDLAAIYGSQSAFPEGSPSAYVNGSVTNNSINDAHNVVTTVTIPSGLAISSASWYTSGNNYAYGDCTVATSVVCTIPVLAGGSPSGDTAYIQLYFTAPSSSQSPLNFSMSVTSNESDSNPQNNTAATQITIVPASDLAISAQFPTGSVQAGQHLTFNVTANNLGPAALNFTESPVAYVDIYGGLNNLVVTPPQGISCSGGFCTLYSFAVNSPLVFTVDGDVPNTGSTIYLSASVDPANSSEPNYDNNNVSTTLTVGSAGNLTDQLLVPDANRGVAYAFTPSGLSQVGSATTGVVPLSIIPMPNGRTAFIVNFNSNYITVFDLTAQTEIYRIQNEPGRVAVLTSDASQLIVSNRFDTTMLDVIDTGTFAVVKHISIGGIAGNAFVSNMFVDGNSLFLMIENTSGQQIYVLNLTTNALSAIPGTTTFGSSLSSRFALTPDGSTLVAVGGGTAAVPATVFLINPSTATLIQSIPLSNNTQQLSVAVTPNVGSSLYAYITSDSTLQMLDVSPADPGYGQFLEVSIELPLSPTSSVITSDGATLAFAQKGENLYPNLVSIPTNSLPSEPSFNSSEYGSSLGVISDVKTDFLPPSNAPQISSITPPGILNNNSSVVQINGSGFSSDAVVKIGTANPIVPTSISGTQLTVTIPPFAASGDQNVVVINQNASGPLSGRNVASLPYTDFFVSDSPLYNPQYDVFIANYGSGSIGTNGSNGSGSSNTRESNPWGVAVTPADIWLATSFTDSSLETSFASEGTQQIALSGGVAYGDALYLVPDPTTGRTVALVPSLYSLDQGITYDWQLNVVDADPYSPTVSTILRTIAANAANVYKTPTAFTVSPDGKFGYLQVYLNDGTSDIVIFDVASGQVTTLTSASLGIDAFVQGLQVSPDSKYLAVANLSSNNIKVFSIANQTSPTPVATIPIQNPNNVVFTDCCNLRFASNNILYAFDPGTMLLQTFNFQPASSNFSSAGTLHLPGNADPTYQGGFAVSPDGAYVYVAEEDDDAIEVIDGTKISTGDINQALITRFSSQGTGPVSIGLNPLPTFSNSVDLAISVSHTPDPVPLGSNITYQITATSLGPSDSGTAVISDVLPQGLTFVSASFSGSNPGTCSGSTVVSCVIGTLAPNTNTVITLVASTAGASVGQIVNTVEIGQSAEAVPDTNLANNVATDTATIAQPDLAVSVSADNLTPSINGTVNFTITVTNNGTVPASEVSVSSTLDAGSLALPNLPNCSLNGSTYTCNFAGIAAGANVSYTEAAQMPSAAGAVHLNTVASETETDANPADNSTTTTITVGGGADVAINAGSAPVIIGGIPTYTVVVTNNGPSTATSVVVTDTLTRFGFVSATSSVGACTYDGIKVSCPIGDMTNGASVTVNVSVTPPDSGWASNEFHAASPTFDPVLTNNIANMGPFGGTVGNTKAGADILVDALDSGSGTDANFLFSSVTRPGLTSITSAAGTQAPTGYRFGSPALVYDLSTTAAYAGSIRVSLQPAGVKFHHPSAIRLFHLENGAWVDRTAALDSVHGLISGMTTSLSPFVIVEPLDAVPVANAGADETLPGANSTGASVTLNGAASTDADSDPLTYTWTGPFPEGNGTVTGINPKVTVPFGTSKIGLVVNDGEVNSTPASINVTVSDFLIAAPASQITLLRGQSASFNVVLSPKYGSFDEAVTVACGSLPSGVTCSIANNSVTPGAQGATATVTLTASASAGLRNSHAPIFAFWLGGLPVLGLILAGNRNRRKGSTLVLLLIALVLIVGMVACGGGGGGSSLTPPPPSSTTTTVTVTGTAGALQHSSAATVVIQ